MVVGDTPSFPPSSRQPHSDRTADRIAPDRVRVLGKMLVAAVQLELFQMLDEICETGDMENELFDDLCCDTIQEGRRNGFVMLTPEVLLSPGSGYKRLLQIRKDQVRCCVCVCVCYRRTLGKSQVEENLIILD